METIVIFSNNEYLDDEYGLGLNVNSSEIYSREVADKNQQFVFAYDHFNEVDEDRENIAGYEKRLNEIVNKIDEGAVYLLPHRIPSATILNRLKEKLKGKGIAENQVIIKTGSNHSDPKTFGLLRQLRGYLKSNDHESVNMHTKVFEKLREQIDTIPSLIQIHKILILERLEGRVTEQSKIEILDAPEFVGIKNAYEQIPNDIREGGVSKILDHISKQVAAYGA